jgi:hypothetical protein
VENISCSCSLAVSLIAPDLAHYRTLDLLSLNQAILLLQELAGPRVADRECVKRLVGHIGGYPLALQLIGSYLSSRQEEVADCLRWFEEEGLVAMHQGEHRLQSVPVLLQRTYTTLTGIVNLPRKMKSIAEVWRRKMLMGHGKWGETCGYATRFAPVTSFQV